MRDLLLKRPLQTVFVLLFLMLDYAMSTAAGATDGGGGGGEGAPFDRHGNRRSNRLGREMKKSSIQEYKLWEPQSIRQQVMRWASHYPDLIRVTTSQEEYDLPAAGGGGDCPFDEDVDGCLNYILTIQDFVAHPEGSESSNELPEVLLSGSLHGNERVGPTAVLETAQLLLEAATCEARPKASVPTKDLAAEMAQARDCRRDFDEYAGVDAGQLRWLARLVATRRIVIVPTANALGYFRNQRGEEGTDPNRDFPFDIINPSDCMQTIAGRTLNEIFRDHLFQLSFTFHGGTELIGYEWGAPTYDKKISPDDRAQDALASAYSRYGGGWDRVSTYKYGAMNDVIYGVRGGMEDWAYAGSWDPKRVVQCDPKTYNGYPAEKTTYDNSTLRVFNMLVETSHSKTPKPESLGTSEKLLVGTNKAGNGHVSRNIRLSLLAIEMVEPYLSIVGVNELELSDDVVPLSRGSMSTESCQKSKLVAVPQNSWKVLVQWRVGGAMDIDSTELWYARWEDIPKGKLNCLEQPTIDDVESFMKKGTAKGATTGYGRFAGKGSPAPFVSKIDLSEIDGLKPHDKIVVIASAQVDESWLRDPPKPQTGMTVLPNLPPQSHIVNARTNPDWFHMNSQGKVVRGRRDWFSPPLTIEIGDYDDDAGTQGERPVATIELSNRFGETSGAGIHAGITPSQGGGKVGEMSLLERAVAVAIVLVVLLCLVMVVRACMGSRVRKSRRSRVREFIEDTDAPSPGLRHKTGSAYADDADGNLGLQENDDEGNGVEMKEYSDAL